MTGITISFLPIYAMADSSASLASASLETTTLQPAQITALEEMAAFQDTYRREPAGGYIPKPLIPRGSQQGLLGVMRPLDHFAKWFKSAWRIYMGTLERMERALGPVRPEWFCEFGGIDYEFGDFLIAYFPYADQTAEKSRPVMVVADPGKGKVVVCRVSASNNRGDDDSYTLPLSGGTFQKQSRLLLSQLATVNKGLVDRKITSLDDESKPTVRQKLRELFGL